jgi:hypothetical protein
VSSSGGPTLHDGWWSGLVVVLKFEMVDS